MKITPITPQTVVIQGHTIPLNEHNGIVKTLEMFVSLEGLYLTVDKYGTIRFHMSNPVISKVYGRWTSDHHSGACGSVVVTWDYKDEWHCAIQFISREDLLKRHSHGQS